jgi:hypothetical protein
MGDLKSRTGLAVSGRGAASGSGSTAGSGSGGGGGGGGGEGGGGGGGEGGGAVTAGSAAGGGLAQPARPKTIPRISKISRAFFISFSLMSIDFGCELKSDEISFMVRPTYIISCFYNGFFFFIL